MEERKFYIEHGYAGLYKTINKKSIRVFGLYWSGSDYCCGTSELGDTKISSKDCTLEDIIYFFKELKKEMLKYKRLSKRLKGDFDNEHGLCSQMFYTIPFENSYFKTIYEALSKTRSLVTKTRKFYNPNSGNNLITYILTV